MNFELRILGKSFLIYTKLKKLTFQFFLSKFDNPANETNTDLNVALQSVLIYILKIIFWKVRRFLFLW